LFLGFLLLVLFPFFLLLIFLFRIGRVKVFCGSFQEQPTYLKYSPDLVLLHRGLFSTINHIVTERQVAFSSSFEQKRIL
jgi:hypothetical protein